MRIMMREKNYEYISFREAIIFYLKMLDSILVEACNLYATNPRTQHQELRHGLWAKIFTKTRTFGFTEKLLSVSFLIEATKP